MRDIYFEQEPTNSRTTIICIVLMIIVVITLLSVGIHGASLRSDECEELGGVMFDFGCIDKNVVIELS